MFDVVIVGAGAAGLAALQMLDQAGLRVILLEARERIGGRIYTVHDPMSPLPVELGAEFVHGRPAELWKLIREAGLTVYDGTDSSRYMNRGHVERNADAWELVGSLLADMRDAAKGADQSFEEFLNGAAYSDVVKDAARGYVEGFNAAESSRISIQALAEETAAADEIDGDLVFRFLRGYDSIPMHLLRSVENTGGKLRLNTIVERVDWQPGKVSLHGCNALTGDKAVWQAAKAILTLPLGVLQAGSVAFTPEPVAILQAANDLEFGQVYRIVLRFRTAFWEHIDELRDAGFILSKEAVFPTWWTSLAVRSTLLTGWSAGAYAMPLQGLTREEVLGRAMTSLSSIVGVPSEDIRAELEAFYFHDWQSDVYAGGAYSYVAVRNLESRRRLSVPVEATLYFAGEATDQHGHSATVHGAIASGRRAALQVLGKAGLERE